MSDLTKKAKQREYTARWRAKLPAATPEQRAAAVARVKAWRKANPKKREQQLTVQRRKHLKRAYGLTEEAFFALLAQQGNRCAVCMEAGKRWVVDHDHVHGHVRGVLCQPCNTGLGCFRDNPLIATNAARYLMVK